MINKLSFLILCTLFISILEVPAQQAYTQEEDNAVSSFTAGGHTVYHLEPGSINGKQLAFSAAYDGTVLCHTPEGELIWKTSTGEGFLFDIEAADIDRDGEDEVLVASSDGALHAIDHNGTLLWRFQREAPLWRVHALETEKGIVILTGGVERTLHALDSNGNEIAKTALDGIIRHLSTGDFKGDGKQYVAVVTTTHRFTFKLRLLELDDLSCIWEQPMIRNGYFSMEVFDFNRDGKDNMVFGLNASDPHMLVVYDGNGEGKEVNGGDTYQGFNWQAIHPGYEWKKDAGIAQLPYTMNLIAYAPGREEMDDRIYNLYGKHLIVKDWQGNVLSDLSSSIVFSNIAYDKHSGKLFLGSELSGGDGVYVINPDMEGWEKEFEALAPTGKIIQLEQNMETLLQQAENFQLPEYQSKPEKTVITLQQNPEEINERYTDRYSFENVEFATTYKYIERYEHGLEDPAWIDTWESHHRGRISSREQILKDARRWEKRGESFLLLGGHGQKFGIDFYISAETLIEVLKVAPNTFVGTAFLELESTGEATAKAVREQLLPLADEFHKHGKIILLRNKNIFWNGSVHLDFWKEAFADPRYREVFVPSMEETNSRTQGLSLAGKTGLLATGTVKHMSGRAVTDNACWNRIWEYGQSGHLSHMLRSLSLRRVYGADLLHINIYSPDIKTQLLPLYLLVDKGALPCPKPEDILSISDVAVGITTPDAEFIEHGTNGHGQAHYQAGDDDFVLDRLDCYWGAATTPLHDFTRMAYESKRRLTNFIPRLPYGMVTCISADTDLSQFPQFSAMVKTDGKYWVDENGNKSTAGTELASVQDKLQKAASSLPVKVSGDVSWSVIRIDPSHVRVILIDPGYLDPADRNAVIMLQHLEGVKCTDILSGEELSIKDRKIQLKVPMGILRVIDIEHSL